MGLGRLFTRNINYDVTNSQTGEKATYTIITDGGPGMYPGWGYGDYRGGMSIPAAWRLSMLIANQLGRMPWQAYRDVTGRPPVRILPTPPLLTRPVGKLDSALGAFRSWGLDRLWHGNGIGVIAAWSDLGWPTAVTPVSAEFVQVKMVTVDDRQPGFAPGELAYLVNGRWYRQDEIIHFKGPTAPGGLRGMGILEEHFDAMDRSRKLDASASAVDSGAVPTGVLKSLNPDMSQTEADELKTSWADSQRTRTVAVLNPLTEFTPIAWNPTETQLIEARKYTLTEWANIFGIDASYVGGESASGTYANIENKGFELLKFGTVGDIIAEFEATLTECLPRGNYVKANVDHLLRNDTKSRYEAHAIAITSGFLTRDEVRELEEKPPLTPEQKAELAAMAAPAPPGNNTTGAGQAPPRLAATEREALERHEAFVEIIARAASIVAEAAQLDQVRRHRRYDPDQPRDPDGKWGDGAGGDDGGDDGGRGPTALPTYISLQDDGREGDDGPADPNAKRPGDVIGVDGQGRPVLVGREGGAGVVHPQVQLPKGYGGGEGTGLKRYKLNSDKYCPTCGGKAQDPQWSESGVIDYLPDGTPLFEVGVEPERDDEPYHDPNDPDYEPDRSEVVDQARRFNPGQPRDSEGKFAETGASDGSQFFSGHGGVQRLPSAGQKLGTGEKATVRPLDRPNVAANNPALAGLLAQGRPPVRRPARPDLPPRVAAALAEAKRQGLARKPKTFPEVNRIADRLGVPPPPPAASRGWTGNQWGAYWATVQAGGDADDGIAVAVQVGGQQGRSLDDLDAEYEIEPDFDGPETDPARDWLPGEAEAWAADDIAGFLRAADYDGSNLRTYWTAGPGLAKWRGSRTPWRTLKSFLSKYLSGDKLERTASDWYRLVFGYLPQDKPAPKRRPTGPSRPRKAPRRAPRPKAT
jgi:HK97 family phage portal protein